MATTNNFGVTLLESSQAQKEITINEAFSLFDAMLKAVVLDKDLSMPPGSPANGAAYIVASSPTGAWSGKAKYIAYYDNGWRFVSPQASLRVWVSDESSYYAYDGMVWVVSNPSGGTGDTGSAWTSYTPTVSAGSGSFASVSATGRYKALGKTVFIQIAVTITANGTAAANVRASLPFTAASFHYALNGRETNSTGQMLNAVVFSGTSTVYITKYDNTYLGANGYVLSVSGVYEAA